MWGNGFAILFNFFVFFTLAFGVTGFSTVRASIGGQHSCLDKSMSWLILLVLWTILEGYFAYYSDLDFWAVMFLFGLLVWVVFAILFWVHIINHWRGQGLAPVQNPDQQPVQNPAPMTINNAPTTPIGQSLPTVQPITFVNMNVQNALLAIRRTNRINQEVVTAVYPGGAARQFFTFREPIQGTWTALLNGYKISWPSNGQTIKIYNDGTVEDSYRQTRQGTVL